MTTVLVFDAEKHCGARSRRSGLPCKKGKGHRTSHPGFGYCHIHGGATANHVKHAASEAAQAALTQLGRPIEKDPQRALLEQVYEAAGNVAFLRERVQALGSGVIDTNDFGNEVVKAIVRLYNEERERLAKISKMAIDAGIAERFVRLAEEQAAAIVRVIDAVLDGLDLDDEQRDRGREIAGTQLRLISGAA